MSHRPSGKIALTAALVSGAVLISVTALATSGWWRCGNGPHMNANGMDCCSINDCAPVPNEAAWSARIGSQIEVKIRDMTRVVIINTIFPSCDDRGQSWACQTGCLFRATGF